MHAPTTAMTTATKPATATVTIISMTSVMTIDTRVAVVPGTAKTGRTTITTRCVITTHRTILAHNYYMKHRNNSIATTIFYAMLINCIICWNVRGIMSSAYPLSNMLDSEKIDVALITEHKLLLRSLHFLDTINSKYKSTCSFDSDVDYFTHVRCGKAGTAILYRKDISNKATCIENIANDRISGIEIRVENCPPIFMF